MGDSFFNAIKNVISDIERAIKSKNTDEAIKKYNLLRSYVSNPKISAEYRKIARDKGLELYKQITILNQEIQNNRTQKIKQQQNLNVKKDSSININAGVQTAVLSKAIFAIVIILVVGFGGFLVSKNYDIIQKDVGSWLNLGQRSGDKNIESPTQINHTEIENTSTNITENTTKKNNTLPGVNTNTNTNNNMTTNTTNSTSTHIVSGGGGSGGGSSGGGSSGGGVTPDTTIPIVNITTPQNNSVIDTTSNYTLVDLNGTSSDNIGVSYVSVSVNSGVWQNASGTTNWHTTLNFSLGQYNISAVSYDTSNNPSSIQAINISVNYFDNIPPTISIDSPINNSNVNGTIYLNATASDNVAVSGIHFQVNGVDVGSNITTPPYSMQWDSATSPDGQTNITAIATDTTGNNATSEIIIINVNNSGIPDTTSPNIDAPEVYGGTNYADYFKGTISIRTAISDFGSGLASNTCQVKINNTAWTNTGVTEDANYCYYNTYNPGTNFNITFRVNDTANNTGTSVQENYTYDVAAPTVGSATIYSGTNSANYFKGTISLRATISDSGVGTASGTCQININNTAWTNTGVTEDANYCYYNTYNPGKNFNITFRVNDSLNNTGNNSNVIFTYDNTAPITTSSGTAPAGGAAYTYNTLTNQTSVGTSLSCSDGTGVGCKASGTLYCTDASNSCTPNQVYSSRVDVSTEGISYIRYRSNDTLDNQESVNNKTIKIDTTNPSVNITYVPTNPNSTQNITFTVTASDANGISQIKIYVNNTNVKNCTTSPCNYTTGFYPDGTVVSYYASANDTMNNVNTTTIANVTINDTADSTAPLVVLSSPTNNYEYNTSAFYFSPTIQGTASDNIAVAYVQVRARNATVNGSWVNATGTTSWSANVNLTRGNDTIDVQSFDNSGNPSNITSVNVSNNLFWVTTYYATWAEQTYGQMWQDTNLGIPPSDINWSGITTVVHFACGEIDPTTAPYFLPLTSTAGDDTCVYGGNGGSVNYQQQLMTYAHAAGTKVVLSIMAVDPTKFNLVVANATQAQELADGIVSYLKNRSYDGVELDVEHWTGTPVNYTDVNRFVRMLNVSLSNMTPRGLFLMSPGTNDADRYNVSDQGMIDQYNLQGYVYSAAWNENTNANGVWFLSPLYENIEVPPGSYWQGTGYFEGRALNGSGQGVSDWIAAGYDPKRIGIGFPAYAVIFKNTKTLYSPYSSGSCGNAEQINVKDLLGVGGIYQWDDRRKVPYVYGTATGDSCGSTWYQKPCVAAGTDFFATYENQQSIQEKVRWAKSEGIGGIMIYDMVSDLDFSKPFGERNPIHNYAIAAAADSPDTLGPDITTSQIPATMDSTNTLYLNVSVYDYSGVYNGTLYFDGVASGSCVNASGCNFTFGPFTAGTNHTYYVTATDNSTNKNPATSPQVNVTIHPIDSTSPQISFVSPSNGTGVSDGIDVSINAVDNETGVSKIELYANGTLIDTYYAGNPEIDSYVDNDISGIVSPQVNSNYTATFTLNTWNYNNGNLLLTGKAYDAKNNSASTNMTLIVNNYFAPDIVIFDDNLTSGWDDSGSWGGNVVVTTNASHSGTSSLEFYQTSTTTWQTLDLSYGTDIFGGAVAYSSVDFWVNGGPESEELYVVFKGTGNYVSYSPINTAVNSWTHVVINMSYLDPNNDSITGIDIRDVNGTADTLYYIDDLKILGRLNDTQNPTVNITYPTNNSLISLNNSIGIITINGTSSDDNKVNNVIVRVNGGSWYNTTGTTLQGANYNWTVNMTMINGTNTIEAMSTDLINKNSTIINYTVTADIPPDIIPPVIQILNPLNGQNYNTSNIRVYGNASDDNAVTYVEVRIKNSTYTGSWMNVTGTDNWREDINLFEGNNTIEAIAYDSYNNNVTASVNVTYTNPGITFLMPTIISGTNTLHDTTSINVSFTITNLTQFLLNWNSVNYTQYDDSLVFMMSFDNVSSIGENSTFVKDISKSNYNMTISGTNVKLNNTGKYGGALELNGAGFVNIGYKTKIPNGTSARTVCLWAKTNTVSSTGILIWWGNGGTNQSFAITQPGTDLDIDAWGNNACYKNGFWTVNVWNHICAEYDGTNALLYTNGNLICNSSKPSWNTATNSFIIGYYGYGGSYFNGTMDELKIWNRTLNATEIGQVYSSNLNKYNSTGWTFVSSENTSTLEDYSFYASAINGSTTLNTETRNFTRASTDDGNVFTGNIVSSLPQMEMDYTILLLSMALGAVTILLLKYDNKNKK